MSRCQYLVKCKLCQSPTCDHLLGTQIKPVLFCSSRRKSQDGLWKRYFISGFPWAEVTLMPCLFYRLWPCLSWPPTWKMSGLLGVLQTHCGSEFKLWFPLGIYKYSFEYLRVAGNWRYHYSLVAMNRSPLKKGILGSETTLKYASTLITIRVGAFSCCFISPCISFTSLNSPFGKSVWGQVLSELSPSRIQDLDPWLLLKMFFIKSNARCMCLFWKIQNDGKA